MKNLFFLIFGLVIIFGSVFLLLTREINPTNDLKNIQINGVRIEVEVVDTLETRTRGLSGRESLPDNTGMLFIFNKSDKQGFWMKDMRFDIDIVWISEDFKVVGVEHQVSPDTFPQIFYSPVPVKYVLELVGGKSQNSGIDIGQIVFFES